MHASPQAAAADFERGFAELAARGLTFDLQACPAQMLAGMRSEVSPDSARRVTAVHGCPPPAPAPVRQPRVT